MPIYVYQCDACNHGAEEFQKMSAEALTECPKCKRAQFHRVPCLAHTDLKEFGTPIELYSIALNDDEEIKEFMRKAPGVEVATDPADPMYGIPIARSRKQKLQALQAMQFTELN